MHLCFISINKKLFNIRILARKFIIFLEEKRLNIIILDIYHKLQWLVSYLCEKYTRNALIPKREQTMTIDVTGKRLTELTWPSQFLKLVSGSALVCLLLLARTFRDTYVPSPRTLSRLSSRAPHLLQEFPHPRERSHGRPDNSAHVRRKVGRTERELVPSAWQIEVEKSRDKTARSRGKEQGLVRGRLGGWRRRRWDTKTEDVRVASRLYRWPRRQMMIATNISEVVRVRSILRNNPGARRTLDFIFRRSDRWNFLAPNVERDEITWREMCNPLCPLSPPSCFQHEKTGCRTATYSYHEGKRESRSIKG